MRKLTILALLTILTACSTSQSVKGIGTGTDSSERGGFYRLPIVFAE